MLQQEKDAQLAISRIAKLGLARHVGRQGFLQMGRGAVILNMERRAVLYAGRNFLIHLLNGDRLEPALKCVDSYNPLSTSVVIAIAPVEDKSNATFVLTTLVEHVSLR
ncbi:MAG TPA: hypothetical protein V6D29_12315 [Leptolyngbyaceae cyanobacterium]